MKGLVVISLFFQDILMIPVLVFGFSEDKCWIHSIIYVIDTNVPCSHSVFGNFVEVDSQTEMVTVRQPTVVALSNITNNRRRSVLVGTYNNGVLSGNGCSSSRMEFPSCTEIYFFEN